MDRNFMSLQRVMQTGNLNSIPDEQRSAVGGLLDSLKDVAIGPQGQTGGEVKKMLEMQMANQLKIRATVSVGYARSRENGSADSKNR